MLATAMLRLFVYPICIRLYGSLAAVLPTVLVMFARPGGRLRDAVRIA